MKYPYTVNHNGVWYPAGADVPTEDTHPSDAKAGAKPVAKAEKTIVPKQRGRKKASIKE